MRSTKAHAWPSFGCAELAIAHWPRVPRLRCAGIARNRCRDDDSDALSAAETPAAEREKSRLGRATAGPLATRPDAGAVADGAPKEIQRCFATETTGDVGVLFAVTVAVIAARAALALALAGRGSCARRLGREEDGVFVRSRGTAQALCPLCGADVGRWRRPAPGRCCLIPVQTPGVLNSYE